MTVSPTATVAAPQVRGRGQHHHNRHHRPLVLVPPALVALCRFRSWLQRALRCGSIRGSSGPAGCGDVPDALDAPDVERPQRFGQPPACSLLGGERRGLQALHRAWPPA